MKKLTILIMSILFSSVINAQHKYDKVDLSGKYYDSNDSLTLVINKDTIFFNSKKQQIKSVITKHPRKDHPKYSLAFEDTQGHFYTMGLTKRDSSKYYLFATDFNYKWEGNVSKK